MKPNLSIVPITQLLKRILNNYHIVLQVHPLPNIAIKKKYILDQASVNTRFVLLCLGSLSVAAITARCTINNYLVSPSFIKVTRNTVITYLASGLFVVPEVFNPYLIYRK